MPQRALCSVFRNRPFSQEYVGGKRYFAQGQTLRYKDRKPVAIAKEP
jgi:hypothetical protein